MAEIKTDDGSLFLYVHSDGYRLPEMAKNAIKKAQSRWNDDSYCTRIIVDQIIKGGRDQEYGYGIMLKPCAEDEYNNDEPSVIIDITKKTLCVISNGKEKITTFLE